MDTQITTIAGLFMPPAATVPQGGASTDTSGEFSGQLASMMAGIATAAKDKISAGEIAPGQVDGAASLVSTALNGNDDTAPGLETSTSGPDDIDTVEVDGAMVGCGFDPGPVFSLTLPRPLVGVAPGHDLDGRIGKILPGGGKTLPPQPGDVQPGPMTVNTVAADGVLSQGDRAALRKLIDLGGTTLPPQPGDQQLGSVKVNKTPGDGAAVTSAASAAPASQPAGTSMAAIGSVLVDSKPSETGPVVDRTSINSLTTPVVTPRGAVTDSAIEAGERTIQIPATSPARGGVDALIVPTERMLVAGAASVGPSQAPTAEAAKVAAAGDVAVSTIASLAAPLTDAEEPASAPSSKARPSVIAVDAEADHQSIPIPLAARPVETRAPADTAAPTARDGQPAQLLSGAGDRERPEGRSSEAPTSRPRENATAPSASESLAKVQSDRAPAFVPDPAFRPGEGEGAGPARMGEVRQVSSGSDLARQIAEVAHELMQPLDKPALHKSELKLTHDVFGAVALRLARDDRMGLDVRIEGSPELHAALSVAQRDDRADTRQHNAPSGNSSAHLQMASGDTGGTTYSSGKENEPRFRLEERKNEAGQGASKDESAGREGQSSPRRKGVFA